MLDWSSIHCPLLFQLRGGAPPFPFLYILVDKSLLHLLVLYTSLGAARKFFPFWAGGWLLHQLSSCFVAASVSLPSLYSGIALVLSVLSSTWPQHVSLMCALAVSKSIGTSDWSSFAALSDSSFPGFPRFSGIHWNTVFISIYLSLSLSRRCQMFCPMALRGAPGPFCKGTDGWLGVRDHPYFPIVQLLGFARVAIASSALHALSTF